MLMKQVFIFFVFGPLFLMYMIQYRILVVDDEEDLCEILQFNLENEGFAVDVVFSSEAALKKDLFRYDLFILDVMMGEISGFRLARMLRDDAVTAKIPIVFLTAKDSENDRLTGFALGADDYISKPFSVRELVARIRAIFRRKEFSSSVSSCSVLRFDTLVLNVESKKVTIDSEELTCTRNEFELLKLLLEHMNRVFTREEILAQVWHEEEGVLSRTVDVNITRLRKKIGRYHSHIVTRLGYGYCFEA